MNGGRTLSANEDPAAQEDRQPATSRRRSATSRPRAPARTPPVQLAAPYSEGSRPRPAEDARDPARSLARSGAADPGPRVRADGRGRSRRAGARQRGCRAHLRASSPRPPRRSRTRSTRSASAWGTGSGSASRRARSTCTSPSWAPCWRAPLRPGRRRRSRGARPHGVRRGGRRGRDRQRARRSRPGRGTGAHAAREPAEPPSRSDDAWVIFTSGSTGTPEGRRGLAPVGRRLRRCRGPAVPAGAAARPRRPGDGRAVGQLRRVVRGDVARLGARRLPGAGPALARAQRHGPGALAGGQRRHGGLHRADAGVRCGPPRRWPRSGC